MSETQNPKPEVSPAENLMEQMLALLGNANANDALAVFAELQKRKQAEVAAAEAARQAAIATDVTEINALLATVTERMTAHVAKFAHPVTIAVTDGVWAIREIAVVPVKKSRSVANATSGQRVQITALPAHRNQNAVGCIYTTMAAAARAAGLTDAEIASPCGGHAGRAMAHYGIQFAYVG